MGYARPPLLVTGAFATNAVANTNTNHVILPALPAGRRYRVKSAYMAPFQNAAAGAIVRVLLRSTGPIVEAGQMLALVGYRDTLFIPEPGRGLGIGGDLEFASLGSLAAISFLFGVYYEIDDVS